MKSLLFNSICLISAVSLMLSSCASDNQVTEEEVIGRWEVFNCERAGKPTQTLNGAYFEFNEGNQLFTNITGDGIMAGYQIYNNEIVQQSGEKIRYKIETKSDEKMTLSCTIRNVDFVLDLVKTSSL